MTETTPEVPPTSSEFAQTMVSQGLQPTAVTDAQINAMLEQMNALQAQVNQLNAERGVPLDRVDGYRQQLLAHFQGRKNSAYHGTDFTVTEGALAALPENSDDLTAHHTESALHAVEQFVKAHPGKELEYLAVLANELHQVVLNREGKHGVSHKRIQDLEAQVAELLAWKGNVTGPTQDFPQNIPSNG